MKTPLIILALMGCWWPACFGQTRPPVLIGVDLLKPVLSLATPNRPAYRLAEVSVKIPLATNYLSVTGGYGQARSDTVHRNMLLSARGYYLKIGIEKPPPFGKGFVSGWNGLIATSHESGSYSFKGPTFGDYVAPIPERQRTAIGVEGVIGHQFLVSQHFALRLSGRATAAVLISPGGGDSPVYFVPGIGNVLGNSFVFSAGLGLHLFYQISSRPALALSNDTNH